MDTIEYSGGRWVCVFLGTVQNTSVPLFSYCFCYLQMFWVATEEELDNLVELRNSLIAG